MYTWSLFLLASLACLSASAHPSQSGMKLLRERRAVRGAVMAGSFYSAPLRKQECENCNELVDENPEGPAAPAAEEPFVVEAPTSVDDTKAEEAPDRKSKTVKDRTASDDDDVPAPRKGGKPRSSDVYKNFFPMTFGSRFVRDAEEGEDGDADVVANAKAEPAEDNEEEEDEDDEDDEDDRSVYRNFFPMTFGAKPRYTRQAEGVENTRGGGVIAIANSFGKGRGAVASSSAVAYGTSSAKKEKSFPPPAEA